MMEEHVPSGETRVLAPGENWMRVMSVVATEVSAYGRGLADDGTISVVSGNAGRMCLDGPRLVAEGAYDLCVTTPAWYARAAIQGLGPFSAPLPLRAIGVFPHDDRLALAVRKETGILSLDDVREKRYPLRVAVPLPLEGHSVGWVLEEILQQHGFTFADIESWGGSLIGVHPGSLAQLDDADPGFDAIFDEAIMTQRWKRVAEQFDLTFLEVGEQALEHCETLGMRRGTLSRARLRGVEADMETVDFSGWALLVHEQAPAVLPYVIARAVERRAAEITSRFPGEFAGLTEPLTMQAFLAHDLPLHEGARRFYSDEGYF